MCDHRNPERGSIFQLGTTGKWMNDIEITTSISRQNTQAEDNYNYRYY
jgi:hypothetical protein